MKKNMLKKVLCSALTAAMILGLAACGKTATSTSTATSTATSTKTSTSTAVVEEKKEPVEISFAVIDLNAGVNNTGEYSEQILNTIREYTGVNVQLQWIGNDVLGEKNSLALANPKTMPQIMSWGGTVTGDVVKAARDGAFVDLNQYIWDAEKYPNLSQLSASVAANLTVNGQLIALPRTRVVGRYGLSYRQDWAEKLGVELGPNATPDDVYNMIYAFTYGDPDGNGIDDTIGMEMCTYTGPFDIIQTWFGCGNGWMDINGQLCPVWMSDNYFEALEYIKKIYDNGCMPKDFASIPTDTWSNGCKTGANGVYIDVLDSGKRIWQYFEKEETYTKSVVNENEAASMIMYGAVNGHTLATAGYNGYFTLSATTLDTEEKIEAALTLLDKLCDQDMLIITQYGLEGVNYTWEDGYITDIDTEDETLANNYKGLNQLLTFLPSAEEATVPVKATKYNDAQNAAYAAALPYAEVNPALSFLVASDTYASEGATLDSEASALRTQYICGAVTLDELKAGLNAIRAKGYDQIISEVNAQYAANK